MGEVVVAGCVGRVGLGEVGGAVFETPSGSPLSSPLLLWVVAGCALVCVFAPWGPRPPPPLSSPAPLFLEDGAGITIGADDEDADPPT